MLGQGRFVIFTAAREQMKGYWLNEYFPQAIKQATEQMPSEDEVASSLSNARFKSVAIEKYELRPQIYLDPQIRWRLQKAAAGLRETSGAEGFMKLCENTGMKQGTICS